MKHRHIDTVIEDQAEGPKPAGHESSAFADGGRRIDDPPGAEHEIRTAAEVEPPAEASRLPLSVTAEVGAARDLEAAGIPLPEGGSVVPASPAEAAPPEAADPEAAPPAPKPTTRTGRVKAAATTRE